MVGILVSVITNTIKEWMGWNTWRFVPNVSTSHVPVIIVYPKSMKEVQEKSEGGPKVINESKQDSGTFLRIQLNIKGLSIIDWVYHFTSNKKLKEK